jgi:hypothetical protein
MAWLINFIWNTCFAIGSHVKVEVMTEIPIAISFQFANFA